MQLFRYSKINVNIIILINYLLNLKAILKTNKWKKEYNVAALTEDHPTIKNNLALKKARVLRHRDMQGRSVIYIPAKNHSVNDREIDELTQFIVFCLVRNNYPLHC
jgi:hypothetical protein